MALFIKGGFGFLAGFDGGGLGGFGGFEFELSGRLPSLFDQCAQELRTRAVAGFHFFGELGLENGIDALLEFSQFRFCGVALGG